MAMTLYDEEQFLEATFVVIDFETTTPRGYSPEPIEVGAIALRAKGKRLDKRWEFTQFMKPPEHAPITEFDINQTGITRAMVSKADTADQVLSLLDQRIALIKGECLLIAHNASVEANVIEQYKSFCPQLTKTPFIDSLQLARNTYPNLADGYGLDAMMTALEIERPPDRHRALADVKVTIELFSKLLRDSSQSSLRGIRSAGRATGRAKYHGAPSQPSLFDC